MIVRTAFRRFCASGRFLTDGGERLEVPVNLHHTLWGFGGLFKLVLELHSLQYEAVRLAHVKHIQRCYKQCTLNLPEEAPPSPKNRRGRLEELSEFLLGTETGMQSAPHETRISRDLPRSPPGVSISSPFRFFPGTTAFGKCEEKEDLRISVSGAFGLILQIFSMIPTTLASNSEPPLHCFIERYTTK